MKKANYHLQDSSHLSNTRIHTTVAFRSRTQNSRINAMEIHELWWSVMKFKIQSRAKSSQLDESTERVKSKIVKINEVLEFDHHPTGDEIQTAITRLPKYRTCNMQFLETLVIKNLPEWKCWKITQALPVLGRARRGEYRRLPGLLDYVGYGYFCFEEFAMNFSVLAVSGSRAR